MECSDRERDIPQLRELILKEWWEKLTVSRLWLWDPGILHRQWGEVQPWVICLRSQRTHFTDLGTGHMSPDLQTYMLTSGQSLPLMHSALHHKKNVKPCRTQGNRDVDCNVPSGPSVIPLSFNGTIKTPKMYHVFMFLQRATPLWGFPTGLYHIPSPIVWLLPRLL